jgi:hypothetical protein
MALKNVSGRCSRCPMILNPDRDGQGRKTCVYCRYKLNEYFQRPEVKQKRNARLRAKYAEEHQK